jgi:cytochrome c553
VNTLSWSLACCLVLLSAANTRAQPLDAGLAVPLPVPDTLAQRLQACTACHGKEGRAAADGYHPRIAGKPAGYLFNQLQHFRQGRRHYGPMVGLVDPLTTAYLMTIAQHFAALNLPYPAPMAVAISSRESAAVLALGRQLALQGDSTRKLPACTACHGSALTGVLPATPGLLGLPRDYISAQLGAWATGQRQAHAPDCMHQVVQRLTVADVSAVSAWLASQPVPADSQPAAALQQPAPLRCGSAAVLP